MDHVYKFDNPNQRTLQAALKLSAPLVWIDAAGDELDTINKNESWGSSQLRHIPSKAEILLQVIFEMEKNTRLKMWNTRRARHCCVVALNVK